MGRSRSRSPVARRDRDRRRSRSRERDRKRDRDTRDRDRGTYHQYSGVERDRYTRRSRSRSPRRSRSRERDEKETSNVSTSGATNPKLLTQPDAEDVAEMTPEDADMMKTMGFSGFDTTKGKKVDGNDIYQANLLRKRRYRQYMNRRGGFNRPLDFIA